VEHRFYAAYLPRAEQRPFASFLLPFREVEIDEPPVEWAEYDEEYLAWRYHGRWDIDGDEQLERFHCLQFGGSGTASVEIQIESLTLGASTEPASSYLAGALLPASLATDKTIRFVSDMLWGAEHLRSRAQIHGAFRWLLEASVVWEPGRPEPPRDELLVTPSEEGGVEIVAFYGRSLSPLERVCTVGDSELYRAYDALALYDPARDATSWVYVAEGEYKAPTLQEAWCEGELVVLTTRGRSWVLDPRAGTLQEQ
jgi:hypothetical protein